MKKIVINGNKMLSGDIFISGAKNSVVSLIPAAILTEGIVEIENVPKLSDTINLEKIISLLGGKIEFSPGKLKIDSKNVKNCRIDEELSTKLRASYYFMGALLGRFKHVEMCFPGGCKIGKRPIDLHLAGFKKLGASVSYEDNVYVIHAEKLKGATIDLNFPSVGATVNLLLAAVLAEGKTVINNVAKEPEIGNLIDLLNNMGAIIEGKNTDCLKIQGVEALHSAKIITIPDRIEAGTYLMMGAVIGKNIRVNNINIEHLGALLESFDKMGVNYRVLDKTSITINSNGLIKPVDITTKVYPKFPTDLGQPMAVLLLKCDGKSEITETIYETRMGHILELEKMGAKVKYSNTNAKLYGPTNFIGTEVSATDLRAGAALIIAGLSATGTTKISNIEYILRGYENIVDKLIRVGADIKIIEE